MTSEQIHVALVIAQAGSISKAAKKLYLTQPTVSGVLTALEREVGFLIFERSNKGVAATPRGNEFLHYARRIAGELAEIEEIGKEGEVCRLHLATFTSTRVECAFERFCMNHQNVRRTDITYQVVHGGLEQRAGLVYDGIADLALITTPSALSAQEQQFLKRHQLCYQFICRMPLTVTMARTHPLAGGDLTMERAAHYPRLEAVPLSPDSAFYTVQDAMELRRLPSIQIDSRQVRLRLASEGMGYFIGMPIKTEEEKRYGLVCRAVPGVDIHVGVIVDCRQLGNAQIREFLAVVREEYRRDSFSAPEQE